MKVSKKEREVSSALSVGHAGTVTGRPPQGRLWSCCGRDPSTASAEVCPGLADVTTNFGMWRRGDVIATLPPILRPAETCTFAVLAGAAPRWPAAHPTASASAAVSYQQMTHQQSTVFGGSGAFYGGMHHPPPMGDEDDDDEDDDDYDDDDDDNNEDDNDEDEEDEDEYE